MRREVNEQWQVGEQLQSSIFWRIHWAAWDNSCCLSNWGLEGRLQSKTSVHQFNRIWSHAVTFPCSVSPQINCVTFPSFACLPEQQLLKPNEWSYCDYFWVKITCWCKNICTCSLIRMCNIWSVWRLWWCNCRHSIRKKQKNLQKAEYTYISFTSFLRKKIMTLCFFSTCLKDWSEFQFCFVFFVFNTHFLNVRIISLYVVVMFFYIMWDQ